MKTKLTLAVLTFSLFLAALQLQAANYYFSQVSGNDSRTSQEAQNPNTPWKSIDKLNAVFSTLQPGDAVYFKRGETFYGTIHINKSGTAGSPIKISAYGSGAKPVITSLVTISNWKSVGGGIFESTTSLAVPSVSVLLVNDNVQEMGRYPNSGTANEGYLTVETVSGTTRITGNLAGSPNWNGGEVVIKKEQWIIDTQKITAHSGNSLTFSGGSVYKPKVGFGFFIKNHIKTLDKFGEWYYNPSNKKMYVYLGNVNPASYKIEAATLDYLLTKNYFSKYLHVENLHLKGANIDAVNITGGSNIHFDQVILENSGQNGLLALSVPDLIFENSIVKNSFNNGLNLRYGNTGAIIRGNTIENSSNFPGTNQNSDGNGIGIFATQDNTLIENNVIRNTGYNGVHFGGNNSIVKNNLIDTFCINKSDGGGIYSFDGSPTTHFKNRKITGNIILNAVGSWGGVDIQSVNFRPLANGIFLDDNSSGIEITGNTVAGAANGAINMSNVSNIIIRDNTFFDGYSQISMGSNKLGRDVRNVTIERNILFSKTNDQYAYRIQTYKNDIPQMADFDYNYFFRPLGDAHSIFSRQEESGKMIEKTENREKWSAYFGKDKNSKSHEVEIETFRVKRTIGSTVFGNGGFDAHIKDITVYDGGTGTWVANKINGGTLKVDAPKTSSAVINVGAVKKDKKYLLRFKSLSNKKGTVSAYLRYRESPWEVVSPVISFTLGTGVSEYQTVLSPYVDVDNTVLRLVTDDPNFVYWIDDLEFVEAEVEMVDPNEQILFEYNASHSPKTINLDGIYVDAKNKTFSGNATIPPFGSLVLVKIGEDVKKEEQNQLPTEPAVDGLYFNTTSAEDLMFGNQTFAALEAKYLLTSGSKVGNYPTGSQETLFQKERFAKNLGFKIPVPNGKYTVRTYHNENYFGVGGPKAKTGQRVFDILLNGSTVKKGLDLYAENKNKETVLEFADIEVKNGFLELQLLATVNNATISGFAILGGTIDYNPSEKVTVPSTEAAYYYNTTVKGDLAVGNQKFAALDAKYLVTSGSKVGNYPSGSQETLFQKERFAKNLGFKIPVPNGKYTVRTYHNENYFGVGGPKAKAGQRVFSVLVNGTTVKKNLDMYAENRNKETVLEFADIEVKNGYLELELAATVNNATISGLAIVGGSVGSKPNEKVSIPSGTAYYYNTTSNDELAIGDQKFAGIDAKYLKTSGSKVGNYPSGSQETLFQKERFAKNLGYKIPVANGKYTVRTYHNENYFGVGGPKAKTGQRVFNILLNGTTVKKNLDLYAEFKNRETVLEFPDIEVKNGYLELDLVATVNNVTISGLAIISQDDQSNFRLAPEAVTTETMAVAYVEEPIVEEISLYPNPARDKTTLVVSAEVRNILIHDMSGRLVRDFDPQMLKSDRGKYTIPLVNMPQGLYLVSLAGQQGMIGQLKLIVNP